jgi:tetratricopeptide (TPR) repeat protein
MRRTLLIVACLMFLGDLNGQSLNKIDSLAKYADFLPDSVKDESLMKAGNLYVREGMIDSAMYYYNRVLKDAEKVGNKSLLCKAKLEIGRTYLRNNEFSEALNVFFEILKISEKENLLSYSGKAKTNIGFAYLAQKKINEGLVFLFEAEKELLVSKDTSGLFGVYTYLPASIGMAGDTAKAIAYFQKGFDLYDAYGLNHNSSEDEVELLDKNRMVLIYNRLDFLFSREELEKDLVRAKAIWSRAETGSNRYHKFEVLSIMASLASKLEQYSEAVRYSGKALDFHDGQRNYNQLTDIYWLKAQAEAALGQYENAYKSLLLFRKYNDSLFNSSQLEAINSVEAKFQVEKKEQKISTLNKEQKAQQIIIGLAITGLVIALGLLGFAIRSGRLRQKLLIKEKEIQKRELEQKMAELEQTALRAQMNPHFIFNCLNSVQRFVIDNDAEGLNLYLSTFATLIRQTLENSGKPLIPLKDEIRYLETYIKMEQLRSNNRFDYVIHVDQGIDVSDIYIPSMIIQPFIENSIQHGLLNMKDKKGHIQLDISRKSKLTFVVEDNGPGIKNAMLLKSGKAGTHISMGGGITEKRIQMYNSRQEEKIELYVEDMFEAGSAETGTRVVLKFPLIN